MTPTQTVGLLVQASPAVKDARERINRGLEGFDGEMVDVLAALLMIFFGHCNDHMADKLQAEFYGAPFWMVAHMIFEQAHCPPVRLPATSERPS